eukprot:scaffold29813_cov52-Phaeocystis_antarctica.AAC.4
MPAAPTRPRRCSGRRCLYLERTEAERRATRSQTWKVARHMSKRVAVYIQPAFAYRTLPSVARQSWR